MAAPVKALVEPTAVSSFPTGCRTVLLPPPISTLFRSYFDSAAPMAILASSYQFGIVTVVDAGTYRVPILPVGVKQKAAGDAAVKMFPPMYRERGGGREMVGQTWPRLVKSK